MKRIDRLCDYNGPGSIRARACRRGAAHEFSPAFKGIDILDSQKLPVEKQRRRRSRISAQGNALSNKGVSYKRTLKEFANYQTNEDRVGNPERVAER